MNINAKDWVNTCHQLMGKEPVELFHILEAASSYFATMPPLNVIVDVAHILMGRQGGATCFLRVEDVQALSEDAELGRAYSEYVEFFLGRLLGDIRILEARNAFMMLDASQKPDAIGVFLSQILSPEKMPGLDIQSPGIPEILSVLTKDGDDITEGFGHGLEGAVFSSLKKLASCARRTHVLIGDAEIYTLEHHEELKKSASRYALEQMAHLSERLEKELPRRMRGMTRPSGNIATSSDDESSYPIGGYSSISNVGSIENLVSSELVYMENGPELDLFDVRWVTNELLKYTRDESVFTRETRRLYVVCSPTLVEHKIKDAESPAQRAVLSMAALCVCVRKIEVWLEECGLEIRIVAPSVLVEEMGLLRLLLHKQIDSGVVTIEVYGEGKYGEDNDVMDEMKTYSNKIKTDFIWICGHKEGQPDIDQYVGCDNVVKSCLYLNGSKLSVYRHNQWHDVSQEGWQGWRQASYILLRGLV